MMNRLRVLLIAQRPDDVLAVRRCLSDAALPPLDLVHVEAVGDAAAHLPEADVVLLDSLAESAIEQASRLAPVIVIGGPSDDEGAIRAIERGAQDCLATDELDAGVLERSIRRALARGHAASVATSRSREEVIGVMSHDLRNPLNVISLSLTLLRRDNAPRELQLRQCEKIERALGQMNQLLQNRLDASHVAPGGFSIPSEAPRVATRS